MVFTFMEKLCNNLQVIQVTYCCKRKKKRYILFWPFSLQVLHLPFSTTTQQKKDLRQERKIYHFIKKQQQNGIDTNPFKYVYLYLETASSRYCDNKEPSMNLSCVSKHLLCQQSTTAEQASQKRCMSHHGLIWLQLLTRIFCTVR